MGRSHHAEDAAPNFEHLGQLADWNRSTVNARVFLIQTSKSAR